MSEHKKHWTEDDVENFVYRIGFDFVTYVSAQLETGTFTQATLADRLGVTEGRVSQILNNPGNLTLKQIVKVARALGRKVSVIAYDDDDPTNDNGPISAGVFLACWERVGKPLDFFALDEKFPLSPVSSTSSQQFDIPLDELLFSLSLNSAYVLGSVESYGLKPLGKFVATGGGVAGTVASPQTPLRTWTITGTANARPEVTIGHLVFARAGNLPARST